MINVCDKAIYSVTKWITDMCKSLIYIDYIIIADLQC